MKIKRNGHAARAARTVRNTFLFLGPCAGVCLAARPAQADVSSWMFVGGGVSHLQQAGLPGTYAPTMRLQVGLGSAPTHPVVFGGLFSLEPNFHHGSDLALLFRSANRSYVTGGFGLALDLGPYARLWGQKSEGGEGMLWFGAPIGLALGVGASVGSHDARGVSAIIGFDFARLTVYRTSGTNWFPNPAPLRSPND